MRLLISPYVIKNSFNLERKYGSIMVTVFLTESSNDTSFAVISSSTVTECSQSEISSALL